MRHYVNSLGTNWDDELVLPAVEFTLSETGVALSRSATGFRRAVHWISWPDRQWQTLPGPTAGLRIRMAAGDRPGRFGWNRRTSKRQQRSLAPRLGTSRL